MARVSKGPPLISVLVPAFNESPDTLEQSFASLRAQTLADFECFVVDDSTDPALAAACEAACARDPRFIYIHPPERLGLAACLNLALARARGRLIARFDSDDVCDPSRFARQAAFLEANPAVDVVGSALEIIDDSGGHLAIRRYPTDHAQIARRIHFSVSMAHPTVMLRKDLLVRHGGYNPEFRYSEDLELWLRLLNDGARFANLPEPLVRYRQVSTHRAAAHWRFNLRARRSNFRRDAWLRRSAGIAGISVWSILPRSARTLIYRLAMFRPQANSVL